MGALIGIGFIVALVWAFIKPSDKPTFKIKVKMPRDRMDSGMIKRFAPVVFTLMLATGIFFAGDAIVHASTNAPATCRINYSWHIRKWNPQYAQVWKTSDNCATKRYVRVKIYVIESTHSYYFYGPWRRAIDERSTAWAKKELGQSFDTMWYVWYQENDFGHVHSKLLWKRG